MAPQLQCFCLENPMDGGAWWATVHGVAEGQTRLSDFTFTFHFHAMEKAMATLSSVVAWRIPGMGELGGLPSMGSHRVRHYWSALTAATAATLKDLIYYTQKFLIEKTKPPKSYRCEHIIHRKMKNYRLWVDVQFHDKRNARDTSCPIRLTGASLLAQLVKNLPAMMQETRFQSLGWDYPTEKEMATHSSILVRERRGQRSLAGCSPWGLKSWLSWLRN